MKVAWGILSLLIMLFASLPVQAEEGLISVISSSPSETRLEIILPELQIRGNNVNTMKMGDLEILRKDGLPPLPFISGIIAIDEQGSFAATVEHVETYRIALDETPASLKEPYPPQQLSLDMPRILRDFRIARFQYIPVQYLPEENELLVTRSVGIAIRKVAPHGKNEKVSGREKISLAFENLYRKVILNFGAFSRFSSDTVLLLIITPDGYESYLGPYVQWKERTGLITKVVKFSDISSNPTYAQIRDFIHSEYVNSEHPPDYFLAIGDAGTFPVKYSYDYSGFPGSYANDNYFVCMDSQYEIFPDIFGARLPVQNSFQLETMLNKIINYEETPYTADPFWMEYALMVADDQYPSQAQTKHRIRESLLAYGYAHVDSIYAKHYFSSYTIGAAITNAVNEGRGFVNYRGRGWSTAWYASFGSIFTISQISGLNNGRKIPVVTSVGCGVAKFDEYNCFGEQWMRNGTPTSEKGAVSFFGPTWNTHTRHNNKLDTGIYRGLFKEGLTTFGEATTRGKYYMYSVCGPSDTTDTQMNEYLILGDPTLLARTTSPKQLTVIHPSVVPLGQSVLLISVSDMDGPVERAFVSASMENFFHVSRHTDSNGMVALPVNPPITDTITISANAKDHFLYEGYCLVQDSGGLVVYRGHTVDDDSSGTSTGNGNGIPNPGEQIELPVLIANKGDQDAFGVTATLTSHALYVTITDSTETLGTIAAGDSMLTPDDFDLSISPSAPDSYPVHLTLTMRDSANTTWQSDFLVRVHTPVIEFVSHNIEDQGQPLPNRILDPGENADIILHLKNTGSISGIGVTSVLRSQSPYVVCNDSISSYGDIAPLEEAEGTPCNVTADSLTSPGYEAEMELIYTTSDGYRDSTVFAITVGMGTDFLIWDKDLNHNSGPQILLALRANGYSGIYDTDIHDYLHMLDSFRAIFICLGINPNNHVLEDGPVIDSLCGYLNGGGRMYMEGGDTWCYDIPTALHPYFRIPENYDGFDDTQNIFGQYGTFTYQMNFNYTGENHWMDQLATYGGSFFIFRNSSPYYFNGIAYSGGGYKTVGVSFEFGGLQDGSPPSTKKVLADSIMHFFGITGVEEEPQYGQVPAAFALLPSFPNPCRNAALIRFQVPDKSRVSLRVFDISGRIVAVLVDDVVEPGYHAAQLETGDLSAGIYFYRLEGPGKSFTRKLVVVR